MKIIGTPISDDLLERAKEALKKQPKYKSTKELSKFRDLYGYIGQLGVVEWMNSLGFEVEHGEYFKDDKLGDDCDFVWRDEKCDVKASSTSKGYPIVYPKTRFLVKDGTKEVDRFVFAKVNLPDKILLIAGTMSWYDFWGVPEEYKKGIARPFESERIKHPCHFVLARELESFTNFVYAKGNN